MTLSFGGGAGVLTIPGLAGDSKTPGGIVVAGAVAAGNDAATGVPNIHSFHGQIVALDTVGNNDDADAVFVAFQSKQLSANSGAPTVVVTRVALLNGHDYTAPMLSVEDYTGSASDLQRWMGNGVQVAHVNSAGGLGLFGHTAPAAPRTLAQATITAITDANAKAAVQACANALADMGVLTLT